MRHPLRTALGIGLLLALTATACGSDGDSADPDHTGVSAPPSETATGSSEPHVSATGVAGGDTVAASAFGMHVNRIAPANWPTAAIGSIRIWNTDSTWGAVEPTPGNWSFGDLDQRLAQAEALNASVILVLGMPPAWAATRPDLKGYGGSPSPPRDLDAWRTYVTEVATRYKGRIDAYEVWNEPNLIQFFVGTPEDLASMTRAASESVRAVDPAAKIVSSGFSARTQGAEDYFKAYVGAGIADAVDVVGIHIYPYPGFGPESMVALAATFRSLADAAGMAEKPMWNTEIGYGRSPDFVFSGPTAASLILRTYLVLPAFGLDRNYWYAWDDRKFVGLYLVDADFRTPNDAAAAYALAERWLVGSTIQSCAHAGTVWTCAVIIDGTAVQIAWSLGGDVDYTPPAGTTIGYTFTGAAAPVAAGGIARLGELPVLFAPHELPTIAG